MSATKPGTTIAERLHLTTTGLIAIGVVLGGWFLSRLIGSRSGFLMAYGATMAIALAWVVSRRRLALTVHRSELPERIRVGQSLGVELVISARRRVSTILIEEDVDPQLGTRVRVPIGTLLPDQPLTYGYTLAPKLRGVYSIGPVTATWSDPFGFTTHEQNLLEAGQIIVHPPTEKVHDRVFTRMWEDPPIRPPTSKPWPVGFEFYGMRDYVPGDDLRRVVWSVLARTGRLMVRESEQGITDRVTVFLDTFHEVHSPGEVSETFESAVKTAASLGVQHLEDGFSVTLITNTGRLLSELRGSKGRLPYLDALARVGRDDKPMIQQSHLLLEQSRSRPHVLVVTPYLGHLEAQQLKLIVDRGISVAVAQVVWEETDPQTASRAASIGAQVVQVQPGLSLETVFGHLVVGRGRR